MEPTGGGARLSPAATGGRHTHSTNREAGVRSGIRLRSTRYTQRGTDLLDAQGGHGGLPQEAGLEVAQDLLHTLTRNMESITTLLRPKKNVGLPPVSDRPCKFMCDPNNFMSFKKNKKIK